MHTVDVEVSMRSSVAAYFIQVHTHAHTRTAATSPPAAAAESPPPVKVASEPKKRKKTRGVGGDEDEIHWECAVESTGLWRVVTLLTVLVTPAGLRAFAALG